MEDDRRMTWIGRHLEIVDATDPTLIGRQGLVLDETRRTLNVLEGDRTVRLGKAGLTFTLDGVGPSKDLIFSNVLRTESIESMGGTERW